MDYEKKGNLIKFDFRKAALEGLDDTLDDHELGMYLEDFFKNSISLTEKLMLFKAARKLENAGLYESAGSVYQKLVEVETDEDKRRLFEIKAQKMRERYENK